MSVDEDHYEYSSPLPSSPDHVQESANYRPLPKPPPISPRQPVPVPATAAASEAVTNGARTSNGDRLKRYSDIPHRSSNEVLKTHTNFAVRLSETAVDFIHKLSSVEEQHAQQLNNVVKAFRKKTNENLKKDPLMTSSSYFGAWESMLSDTESEARLCTELSQKLVQSVSQQLTELTARKKHLMKKWYLFRDSYMSRMDKAEDYVFKLSREYQDTWTKYAEALERGENSVKESVVLHSYNAHNEYVMHLRAFNSLHDEYYSKQIYDMLDELQAVHEDLVKGFRHCMQKKIQLTQAKYNSALSNLNQLSETFNSVSAPSDISLFVSGQNVSVKVYPPPNADFKSPTLPTPKLPDTPPIDLSPLSDGLQLVDLTQAPLVHTHEDTKKLEFEMTSSLDQFHKEYQSVKTLLDSYRENPSLGDPNSLIEELLEMRNKIRFKEAELVMVREKLSLFTILGTSSNNEVVIRHNPVEDSTSPPPLFGGKPTKSSDILAVGRSHDFFEDERKFKKLVFCYYCNGLIQPPISRGVKCKVCKLSVHNKCQHLIPYCIGQPPTKDSPKLTPKVPKAINRFSKLLTRKSSNAPSEGSDHSFADEDDDETLGGLYEAPPFPPPKPHGRVRSASPVHVPSPPPRGESLDPRGNAFLNSFEDTLDFGNALSSSYCVALFDYDKVNPNDISINAGDVIELINTGSIDWWKGSLAGKTGYFPAAYVQAATRGDVVMRALFDFSPSSDSGEVRLEEGQIIVMTRNDGDGWLFGKSGEAEGLFPENYVQRINVVK